jgi:hypothetical protein
MLAAAQIRQFVAQRLQGCAFTGGRVFEGRYHPAVEAELPCWFVGIESEDTEALAIDYPAGLETRLRLVADGFAVSVDALESALDTLQLQALQALQSPQPPWQLRCVGVRRRVHDGEGQAARQGAVSLFLEAVFITVEGDPESIHV